MNNLENDQYLERMYDDFNQARGALMNDLKNDKDCSKEKVINAKMLCVDNILKNLLKYRNIRIKDKQKQDL
jgi:hypothetical protein